MSVPNTFSLATGSIPLSQLDANFAYYDAAFQITGSAMSLTGAVTLSAGTANGIPYLNGSKVLTSGSALTFDGTNLGVVNSAPTITVFETASGNNNRLIISQSGITTSYNSTYSSGDAAQAWKIANTEGMRLTSTGLGIGTSSPAYKLDVRGVLAAGNGTIVGGISYSSRPEIGAISNHPVGFITNNTTQMLLDTSGNLGVGTSSVTNAKLKVSGAAAGGAIMSEDTSGSTSFVRILGDATSQNLINWQDGTALRFATSTQAYGTFSERMRLDNAGNLGLGVTPSAWAAANRTLQIGRASFNVDSVTGRYTNIVHNAYYDTTWRYIASSVPAVIQGFDNASGSVSWNLAPSGTTGNAISFTQAMTLDASGNLLVGTTSGNGRVQAAQRISTSDVFVATLGSGGAALVAAGSASTMTAGYWITSSGYAGSITCSGTTTLYSVTSDYRLKTVLGAVTDSGTRIDALEPIEYEWKSDGSRTRGFLAHKFQEVYAGSVTGTKDAVDAEGKPVYQAMQAGSSEVIADLVAEIQSLRKRLAAAGI